MWKFLGAFLDALGSMPVAPQTNTQQNVQPDMKLDNVYIQTQDSGGVWRTYQMVTNHPFMITSNMQNLSEQFPGQRVRAVDENNRIVDIL
jgi:Txe/YoeB family toxin of Txe-Axe toxin-antitoxin module